MSKQQTLKMIKGKKTYALLTLAVGLLTACSGNEVATSDNGQDIDLSLLTAFGNEPVSRTSARFSSTAGIDFDWTHGDEIWVQDDATPMAFQKSVTSNIDSKLSAGVKSTPTALFYLPGTYSGTTTHKVRYTGNGSTSANAVTIAKEQSQTESNSADHLGVSGDCGTAIAGAGTNRFMLTHKASYLAISSYSLGSTMAAYKLTEVKLSADEPMAGTFGFDDNGINETTPAPSNTSKEITMKLAGGNGFSIPASEQDDNTAIIVVKPGTYHHLRIAYTLYNKATKQTVVLVKNYATATFQPGQTLSAAHDLQVVSKQYTESDATIWNPERGFYSEQMGFDFWDPDAATIKAKGNSLVLLIYYLKGFTSKDISAAKLARITTELASVRNSHMKAILRFAYTDQFTSGSSYGSDAPMNIIKRHLDQLKPLFEANKDVIACFQAGFIGVWGEWYYSKNHLNNTASYNELMDKWLSVLPSGRTVQIRTPKYKMDYIGSTTALTDATAYNDANKAARIGHHNDAFSVNETNDGTYQSGRVEADKDYVAQDGLYVPIGGESYPEDTGNPGTYMSGANAVKDLKQLHWSFLNDLYDQNLLQAWYNEGYKDTLQQKLGYRLVLKHAAFSKEHKAGSALMVNIQLKNVGWAPLYLHRPVKLILRPTSGSQEYVTTLNIDPRTWKAGKEYSINEEVALPASIANGNYKVFLWLPDEATDLQSIPEYSVQFANTGVWESATGYNDLGITISVSSSANVGESQSSVKFVAK